MKVLWFEVTEPSRYQEKGLVIGGWQDSLENIVRGCPDIELFISFETNDVCANKKVIDGVTYIPIKKKSGIINKIRYGFNSNKRLSILKESMKHIVEEVNPDLIQVYGTEWPYGYVADVTNIPVVIHIMGSLIPYANAFYAPGFSFKDLKRSTPFSRIRDLYCFNQFQNSVLKNTEVEIWEKNKYYMGRTEWDRRLSSVLSPNCSYFHVEEALRPVFFSDSEIWTSPDNKKIKLMSTGCSNFWKGPDMLLKTAQILKRLGVDFEWVVAGKMNCIVKKAVEKNVGTTFEENNIKLIGFTKPLDLKKLLCASTMYVHTAYAENSPNSICEAQLLGVPIISTYVGGIPSLLGADGMMVPANDPWQMASAIVELANDRDKMELFSKNGRQRALIRHSTENIKRQLFNCYNSIIKKEM